MTTTSPPKPWERGATTAGAGSSPTATATAISAPSSTMTSSNTASSAVSTTPLLPDRPSTLNSVVNQTASNYSPYGQSRLGTSPYSSYGGVSSYTSPYSRMGGMGGYGSMYGSGYGSGYGSMYGGMGNMGGMYGGGAYGAMPQDPNNPNSMTQSFNQSTQATFQIIESIVGAFGGFAQMLESTYMATHSSFFAMVSVAEQFGNLRNTLGSVLGIFAILRWLRTLLAKITGKPPPADAMALTPTAFQSFLSGDRAAKFPTTLPDGSPAPPRPSRKPLIVFALAVFGLPYLMGKLIKALAASQDEVQKRQLQANGQIVGPNGQVLGEPIDPRNLDFCRLLYDYTPSPQSLGIDLEVKKGHVVAVISKTDPTGNPSEWWYCRARDGKYGYLPSPYLERIERKPTPQSQQAITSGSAPGSRTTTLRASDGSEEARTKSLSGVGKPPVADLTVESFQKGAFHS